MGFVLYLIAKIVTRFGKYWADWLNKREKNHVEIAIEDDETK